MRLHVALHLGVHLADLVLAIHREDGGFVKSVLVWDVQLNTLEKNTQHASRLALLHCRTFEGGGAFPASSRQADAILLFYVHVVGILPFLIGFRLRRAGNLEVLKPGRDRLVARFHVRERDKEYIVMAKICSSSSVGRTAYPMQFGPRSIDWSLMWSQTCAGAFVAGRPSA